MADSPPEAEEPMELLGSTIRAALKDCQSFRDLFPEDNAPHGLAKVLQLTREDDAGVKWLMGTLTPLFITADRERATICDAAAWFFLNGGYEFCLTRAPSSKASAHTHFTNYINAVCLHAKTTDQVSRVHDHMAAVARRLIDDPSVAGNFLFDVARAAYEDPRHRHYPLVLDIVAKHPHLRAECLPMLSANHTRSPESMREFFDFLLKFMAPYAVPPAPLLEPYINRDDETIACAALASLRTVVFQGDCLQLGHESVNSMVDLIMAIIAAHWNSARVTDDARLTLLTWLLFPSRDIDVYKRLWKCERVQKSAHGPSTGLAAVVAARLVSLDAARRFARLASMTASTELDNALMELLLEIQLVEVYHPTSQYPRLSPEALEAVEVFASNTLEHGRHWPMLVVHHIKLLYAGGYVPHRGLWAPLADADAGQFYPIELRAILVLQLFAPPLPADMTIPLEYLSHYRTEKNFAALLQRAITSDADDVCVALLTHVREQWGPEVMRCVVDANRVDFLRLLMGRGFQCNVLSSPRTDESEQTPLHRAVATNRVDIVRTMIELGVDVNSRVDDEVSRAVAGFQTVNSSPLSIAVLASAHTMLTLLLELGADVHASNALDLALTMKSVPAVEILLDHGANPANRNYLVYTHLPVRLVERLLVQGAALESINPVRNASPLQRAFLAKDVAVTRVLLEYGAVPRVTENDDWAQADWRARWMKEAAVSDDVAAVQLLLDLGVPLPADSKTEQTATLVANTHLATKVRVTQTADGRRHVYLRWSPRLHPLTMRPLRHAVRALCHLRILPGGDNDNNGAGETAGWASLPLELFESVLNELYQMVIAEMRSRPWGPE